MATYESYKDSGVKWLGQIPSHWEIKKLRAFFDRRNHKVSDTEYAPLSVTKNGIVPQMENVAKSKDNDNRRLVKIGDFVINSRSDRKGSSGVSELEGSVSFVNTIMIPRDGVVPTFCNYLLKSNAFIEENYRNGHGIVADLWTTSFDEQKLIKLAMPPVNEQEAIVAYLDKVTGDIDRAIEAQQKMIDALNERKQIIITRAVTRGLNPDAPLRDSGIDWLGQIPEHWEIVRTSFVFPKIGSGTTPSSSNESYYSTNGINWLQTGDLNDGILYNTSKFLTSKAMKEVKLRVYPKGSIVIAMYGATIGKTAILNFESTVNQACCVLPATNKCISEYALYYFQTTKNVLIQSANGGGQPNINQQLIRRHRITLPPVEEQGIIVQSIKEQTTPLNESISNCERMISLLQERKQIIINEVVTGKTKVI